MKSSSLKARMVLGSSLAQTGLLSSAVMSKPWSNSTHSPHEDYGSDANVRSFNAGGA